MSNKLWTYEFRIWPSTGSVTRGGKVGTPEFNAVMDSIGYVQRETTEEAFRELAEGLLRNGWELHEVSRWIEEREVVFAPIAAVRAASQ